ncbi:MAG TPA: hypothetical protein VMF33_08915 [Acidimicrobiales bacterium]|nr:hypothetical protein [Acidimicrobiales bacterium]
MSSPHEQVSVRYLYRSVAPLRRGAETLYLVSRLEGSNVLARIEVVETAGASLRRTRHPSKSRETPLRVVSPWLPTLSRHHAKARVTLAS